MENTISVATAAKCLGIGQQAVRVGLQRGLVDFGYAIKDEGENHRWVYVIPRGRFIEKTGIGSDSIKAVEAASKTVE